MTAPRGARVGRARVGAGLAALYVVVAAVTDHLSSRPVLPLFDGFAPPTPYAWVNPPPERTSDNVPPKSAEREFPLGPEGSAASNEATDDAQAILGLDKGSVPPRPPDTGVVVRLVPADAATLGPLPAGLRVVSNAYQVSLTYVPSQTPLTQLPVKGTIALTAAEPGDRLLFSPDGGAWQERPFRPFGQDHGVFTELDAPGWFVVASSAAGRAEADEGPSLVRPVLLALVGVTTVAGAAAVVLLPSPVPVEAPPRRTGRRKRPRRRR